MEFFDRSFAARLEKLSLVRSRLANRSFNSDTTLSRRGHSPEFHDYREYAYGEELRHVDWNLYSRLGKYYCREYEQENDLHLFLMIDCSASMSAKFYRTLQLTAALAYCALCGGCRVEIQPLYEKAPSGATAGLVFSGRDDFIRLCKLLTSLEVSGGNEFNSVLRRYHGVRTVGQGVRVVLSDFFWESGVDGFLRQLRQYPDELYLIQHLAAEEVAPSLSGRTLLHDSENGEMLKMNSLDVLGLYRQQLHTFARQLCSKCSALHCGYTLLDASMELEDAVMQGLTRCGLLL